ncbi:MAG: serine/threonine-protein kinase [Polyangiaceae bacterium]
MSAVSPSSSSGAPVSPGDIIADKYLVEAIVAQGGMGVVVSARHRQLGQQVAIKVLLPSELTQEPNAIARFLREARAAATLQSEHVVKIFDVGTLDDGLPFMVMELMRGDDLRSLLRKHGPVGCEAAASYVIQACDAVGEAHESGIVHRDLKPSNLFLAQRRDGSAVVKVLDFGISKAPVGVPGATMELTTSSVMMGSPLYMSPEQIRDARSVDHRTDIWSLGVILYQLVTGKPPFMGDSLPAVCAAIAADAPTPITRADVPMEFQEIIWRCLSKRPEQRYASVAELASELAPFAGSRRVEPVLASAPAASASLASAQDRLAGTGAHALHPSGGAAIEAATVSYGRLLSNKDALRAAPTGVSVPTDAPLASTLSGQLKARKVPVLLALLALLLAGGLALALLTLFRRPAEPTVVAAPAPPPSPVVSALAAPATVETANAPAPSELPAPTPVVAPAPAPAPKRGTVVKKATPAPAPPTPKPTSDIRKTR